MNKYLKDIMKKCGVDKNITHHVVSHTFATTVTLLNDVPIETVSKILGHKKLSTTQRYARVVEKKISNDMAELRMKWKKPMEQPEYKKRHVITFYKSFFVFHHCLISIILGSPMFIKPFPESNFFISVSSLYLLFGVPTKLLIAL